jgi:dTDP-4-dehydrorhamnose 3,5-epimerase-like enzyme
MLGVGVIEPERHEEHRGRFARMYCEKEFVAERSGLEFETLRQTTSDLEKQKFLAVHHQEIEL